MDETHPRKPVNPYGRSKLAVEFISLRYFNAAGADPDLETGEWHEPETGVVANPGKAKEVIGWTPRYGIEDIIDTALRWYKKLLRLV